MSCKKVKVNCPHCGGKGKVTIMGSNKTERCEHCNGSGKVYATEHHFTRSDVMCDCGEEAAPDRDSD